MKFMAYWSVFWHYNFQFFSTEKGKEIFHYLERFIIMVSKMLAVLLRL